MPIAYRLDLTIDPDKARFSGRTSIDVSVGARTNLLWINGKDFAVSRVIARIGKQMIAGHYRQVDQSGVARIDFDEPLPPGRLTLAFRYDAPIGDDDHGLYHARVGNRWYAWTNDEPTGARSVFPSFDEPGFKTPYTITVTTARGNVVVSNAPDAGVTRNGKLELHRFAATYPLPSYLVAIAVGPFAKATNTIAPTAARSQPLDLRVFATAELAERLAYPADNTAWFIRTLEEYFGSAYPYQKLDLVASPVMAGGMENAGIVMDDDSSLLSSNRGRLRSQQSFAILQAHELAHQWFGDLVSPAWWTDSWLNESFAEWLGFKLGDRWRPALDVRARGYESVLYSMRIDQLTAGRPVHARFTNSLVDASLDAITYGKGAQIIGMAETFMGADTFRKAVQLHIARHRYGNANADDFYGALAETSSQPKLVAAMRSFTDQTGLPVIDVTREGNRFRLVQSRYTLVGSPTPPASGWIVPFCLRQGDRRQCTLIDGPEATVPATSAPVIPNANGGGYYRFNLSDEEWRRLIDEAPRLSLGEALLTIDSLWAAFAAGKVDPDLLLQATQQFASYPDASVMMASADHWGELVRSAWFDDAGQRSVAAMLRRIYERRLAALGFDPSQPPGSDDDIPGRLERSGLARALALDAHAPAPRVRLATAARAYIAGDRHALSVDYLGAGLGVLVQTDGLAIADALFTDAVASYDAQRRETIFEALGLSDNPEIARWLLRKVDDRRVNAMERSALLSYLFATPHTRSIALAWLLARPDHGEVSSRRAAIAAPFCSIGDADTLAALTAVDRRDPRRNLEFDRALERIRSCAALKDTRRDAVLRAVTTD